MVYGGTAPDGTSVALKTLWPGYSSTRFKRECRILLALDHPNIVRVLDTVEQSGRAFLVMEQVDGRSLRELISERFQFEPSTVASVGMFIADALAYAHREGVVHRDVTPGNIVLTDDLHPKLLDFGIAAVRATPSSRDTVRSSAPRASWLRRRSRAAKRARPPTSTASAAPCSR